MSIISKLISYPLKSGAGIYSDIAYGTKNGITGDRLFCLYCPESKKFISLRDNPNLVNVSIENIECKVSIKCGNLKQSFYLDNPNVDIIKIWSRSVEVESYPGSISDYIGSYLKMNVCLAKISDFIDYKQCFMDTGPIHIISQKSLDNLSRHVGLGDIDFSIFRPNIIVPDFGCECENDIKEVIINGYVFKVTEATERCDAVSILHRKLQTISDSPILEVLDELNGFDGATFGIYLSSETDFCIKVSDPVEFK